MYTSNQTATSSSMQVQRQMHKSLEMKHCNSKHQNANHDETQQHSSKHYRPRQVANQTRMLQCTASPSTGDSWKGNYNNVIHSSNHQNQTRHSEDLNGRIKWREAICSKQHEEHQSNNSHWQHQVYMDMQYCKIKCHQMYKITLKTTAVQNRELMNKHMNSQLNFKLNKSRPTSDNN